MTASDPFFTRDTISYVRDSQVINLLFIWKLWKSEYSLICRIILNYRKFYTSYNLTYLIDVFQNCVELSLQLCFWALTFSSTVFAFLWPNFQLFQPKIGSKIAYSGLSFEIKLKIPTKSRDPHKNHVIHFKKRLIFHKWFQNLVAKLNSTKLFSSKLMNIHII